MGSFDVGHLGPIWADLAPLWAHFGLQGPFLAIFGIVWSPTGTTRELGVQTHGDRVALRRGTLLLGLGSFWAHFGLFWPLLGPFRPHGAHFWPFLAIMWPPTGATRELGAQTWWVGAP
jgi:hypothetical protein